MVSQPVRPRSIKGPTTVSDNQSGITYSVSDIGFTYKWYVPEGVTITSGQNSSAITVDWGLQSGSISVDATNNCGTSHKKEKFITVYSNKAALRIPSKIPVNNKFVAYPNPVINNVNIEYTTELQGLYTIEFTDITGRRLWSKTYLFNKGSNKINIDFSKYQKGVYLATIRNKTLRGITAKIIKQ